MPTQKYLCLKKVWCAYVYITNPAKLTDLLYAYKSVVSALKTLLVELLPTTAIILAECSLNLPNAKRCIVLVWVNNHMYLLIMVILLIFEVISDGLFRQLFNFIQPNREV
jgi:hypothetical protein